MCFRKFLNSTHWPHKAPHWKKKKKANPQLISSYWSQLLKLSLKNIPRTYRCQAPEIYHQPSSISCSNLNKRKKKIFHAEILIFAEKSYPVNVSSQKQNTKQRQISPQITHTKTPTPKKQRKTGGSRMENEDETCAARRGRILLKILELFQDPLRRHHDQTLGSETLDQANNQESKKSRIKIKIAVSETKTQRLIFSLFHLRPPGWLFQKTGEIFIKSGKWIYNHATARSGLRTPERLPDWFVSLSGVHTVVLKF